MAVSGPPCAGMRYRPGFSSPLRSRCTITLRPSGVIPAIEVRSSPPVSWTGKRSGPSSRQTCGVPVTDHPKKSRVPSGAGTPMPGARTSIIIWMRAASSGGRGFGAYFAITSGGTLPTPWPW